jgi:peroxin-7
LKAARNPIRSFEEHKAEVYSVDWNMVEKERFISGSWDDTIKLWHPEVQHSIRTFREHQYCVYSAIWSPSNADLFASVSGDCTLKIWDCNGTSHDLLYL